MPSPRPPADQVIIAVFDGLRPDLVGPELTPNLLRLKRQGTWFREARSVFPSVTRVATTSIATGTPPAVHGIMGNTFYLPAAFPDRMLDTSQSTMLQAADRMIAGGLVTAETLGDQLARAGKRLCVVHTGSAGAAHLINPRAAAQGHWTFSIHGPEHSQTPAAVSDAVARFGPLPQRALPRLADADYAADVMVGQVLAELEPAVALVWFNEPDTSFHYRGIGSADARRAIRQADAAFGRILDSIEARPDADRIAVIASSDHGQIATTDVIDLFDHAQSAGFTLGQQQALDGVTFVATGGRYGEIRLRDGRPADVARLAAWLLDQPAIGHVFMRDGNGVEGAVPGTLSLDLFGAAHARHPDLMFVLRDDHELDADSLPGRGAMTPGDVPLGGGMHGGLNRHELNTLLMIRADGALAADAVSNAPAGIIDIAPTVLGLLGLPAATTMVGRDLVQPAHGEARTLHFEAAQAGFAQRVQIVEEDGRRFVIANAAG